MGLDGVELLMEIEETFGIEISDFEACNALTVDQLYQIICQKYQIQACDSCPTRKAFYQLRKTISDSLKINKHEIRPKTKTEAITKIVKSKDIWNCLKDKTGYRLPNLKLPRWLHNILLLTGFLMGPLLVYLMICILGGNKIFTPLYGSIGIVAVLFVWLFLGILIPKLIFPFQTVFPNNCETIGNLSKQVVMLNAKQFEPLSKQEVWKILVKIISEQSGLDKNEIKPETSFREIFPYG